MATIKKVYEKVAGLVTFPSEVETIEVNPNDGYNGAHRYRAQMCAGFENGETQYVDKTDTIQFVQKNEDGTVIPGWQSEQIVNILIDRTKKLNEKFPSEHNEKMIEGLQTFLDACKERISERIDRGVMGKLQK